MWNILYYFECYKQIYTRWETPCQFDLDRNLRCKIYLIINFNSVIYHLLHTYCVPGTIPSISYKFFNLIITIPIVACLNNSKLTNEVTKALRSDLKTWKFKIRSICLTIKLLQVLQAYHAWLTWPEFLGKWICF